MSSAPSAKPFISICIPAYKRPDNVRRLLQSIRAQTFKDFEVVITDDSPDDTVQDVLPDFDDLPIRYHKNVKALGTPANWNYGIELAAGEWIKIMHDDDWFAEENSLKKFTDNASGATAFIVARYRNVFENGSIEHPSFPSSWKKKIIDNPLLLLSRNVIGPPSVMLIHSSISEKYDPSMKWRVDIDYYVRLLKTIGDLTVINEVLVNVGISSSQVTNSCINMPEVELPEGQSMLLKYGTAPLENIRVYDAWWRILRNVGVRGEHEVKQYGEGSWPEVILKMASFQASIPASLLKVGIMSKLFMGLSFILNRKAENND